MNTLELNSKYYKVAYYTIERVEQYGLGVMYYDINAKGKRGKLPHNHFAIKAIEAGEAEEIEFKIEEPKIAEPAKKQEEPATAKQIAFLNRLQVPYPRQNLSKKYASFLIEEALHG